MLKKLNNVKSFFLFWLKVSRAFSLPMSICAVIVPFFWGLYHYGNLFNGLLALIGVIFAHLGANMFDDFLDYNLYLKKKIELYEEKCAYIKDGSISLGTLLKASLLCFAIAGIIGYHFVLLFGANILVLIGIAGLLCLVYPILTFIGLGEVILGLLFGPMLFTGVYFVMTKSYSLEIAAFSISYAMLTILLTKVHSFMDYKQDTGLKKRTQAILLGTQKDLLLIKTIVVLAYLNLVILVVGKTLPPIFLLPVLSITNAAPIMRSLADRLGTMEFEAKEFQANLIGVTNLCSSFTILLTISIIIFYLW